MYTTNRLATRSTISEATPFLCWSIGMCMGISWGIAGEITLRFPEFFPKSGHAASSSISLPGLPRHCTSWHLPSRWGWKWPWKIPDQWRFEWENSSINGCLMDVELADSTDDLLWLVVLVFVQWLPREVPLRTPMLHLWKRRWQSLIIRIKHPKLQLVYPVVH